jgi:hypothetical protein
MLRGVETVVFLVEVSMGFAEQFFLVQLGDKELSLIKEAKRVNGLMKGKTSATNIL